MATLSNPTYYVAGKPDDTYMRVGVFTNGTSVVRYDLTIDENESASHINIYSHHKDDQYPAWGYYNSNNQDWAKANEKAPLSFYIGTNPDEFVGAETIPASKAMGAVDMCNRRGDGVEENCRYDVRIDTDAFLLPGVTYYLWIFPAYTSTTSKYYKWYDTTESSGNTRLTHTVTLSGAAGLVYINTGTAFVPAIPYIYNGSEWKQAIPYVHNGSSWQICG